MSRPDYSTPRKLLNALPGVELVEMQSSREGSMCCGAGGGVKSAFPEISILAAQKRIIQAKETGASYLITTCPFCRRNLMDGNEQLNLGMKIMDLTELILERLE